MTPALSATAIVSGYHNRPVLHGLSLTLEKGRMVGLIGPNGHGKTTLLRTLSGLVPLRSGEVAIDGQDVGRASVDERVEAGLIHVPQGDQLFGDMTVEENLRMGAYLRPDQAAVRRSSTRSSPCFPAWPSVAVRRPAVSRAANGAWPASRAGSWPRPRC